MKNFFLFPIELLKFKKSLTDNHSLNNRKKKKKKKKEREREQRFKGKQVRGSNSHLSASRIAFDELGVKEGW